MYRINIQELNFLDRKLSFIEKLSDIELANIHGGEFDYSNLDSLNLALLDGNFNFEDFTWGAIAGGVVYDIAKGVTFGTAEFIGDNVFEGWSPSSGLIIP